jgi:hypothetical protein
MNRSFHHFDSQEKGDKRDSVASKKSIQLLRESLGILHQKVEKIFKDAPPTKFQSEKSLK